MQARAEHHVGVAFLDGLDDLRQQRGIVLIIRVDHHDDVGAGAQSFAVAGLLVGAVAVVAVVNEQFESQLAGDLGGLVGAAVVHQDDQVDHVARQIGIGHVERLGGVIRRHHHHHLGLGAHNRSSGRAATMN